MVSVLTLRFSSPSDFRAAAPCNAHHETFLSAWVTLLQCQHGNCSTTAYGIPPSPSTARSLFLFSPPPQGLGSPRSSPTPLLPLSLPERLFLCCCLPKAPEVSPWLAAELLGAPREGPHPLIHPGELGAAGTLQMFPDGRTFISCRLLISSPRAIPRPSGFS